MLFVFYATFVQTPYHIHTIQFFVFFCRYSPTVPQHSLSLLIFEVLSTLCCAIVAGSIHGCDSLHHGVRMTQILIKAGALHKNNTPCLIIPEILMLVGYLPLMIKS